MLLPPTLEKMKAKGHLVQVVNKMIGRIDNQNLKNQHRGVDLFENLVQLINGTLLITSSS